MKIAIEAQRIFRNNKHGMDFVVLECIRELQKLDHNNEYFIFVSPGPDHCLNETENFHIIEVKCPSYPLWEQIALPLAIKKFHPDLLHCTSNTAPIFCNVPLVLTLHDIIFLEKRQSNNTSLYQEMGWHYRRLIVPRIINKCKKIITVSNFEHQQIQNALNIPNNILTAIYNGFSDRFHVKEPDWNVISKYTKEKKFFFFLGNTDPKKNAYRMIEAYGIYLKKSKEKRHLLIADLNEDFLLPILKKEKLESIKSYLEYPGYIANTDLPEIYNGAFAFIYPSLRESFGIPMLEAMACGTPLIAANTSAMPEIAGESALLIDPFSPQDIANMLIELENNENLYKQAVDYGLERSKLFNWNKTAQKLLEVYKEVVNQN